MTQAIKLSNEAEDHYIMKIVVFGGTGFLGSELVRHGLRKGHKMSVICRSRNERVRDNLEYIQGDIFHPKSYQRYLQDADAVIDAVGTFMPDPGYKDLLKERLGPCTAAKLAQGFLKGPNPLSGYEKLNTESAAIVSSTYASLCKSQRPFVYISAESWLLASAGYIESKRRAEQLVASHPTLRPVLIRPGFMHGQKSSTLSVRSVLAGVFGVADALGADIPQIDTRTVAAAALEAIEDPGVSGVISNSALQEYARMSPSV